jgi:hypothetical protein
MVLTLNNDGREREVELLSGTASSPDFLALGPATVLLRDEPSWRSALPTAAGNDAAGLEAVAPMPKGDPGTTMKDANIVAIRRGDGR